MEDKKTRMFLRIKNFKCFEDITIEFKPLMLLFGANGSGKSTLHQAIRFFFYNLFFAGYNPYVIFIPSQEKIFYKINIDFDNLDLISFKEVVRNNDTKNNIEFELSILNAELDNKPFLMKIESQYKMYDDFVDFHIKFKIFQENGFEKFVIEVFDEKEKVNKTFKEFENPFFHFVDGFEDNMFFDKLEKVKNAGVERIENIYKHFKIFYAFPNFLYEKYLTSYKRKSRGLKITVLPNVRIRPQSIYLLSNNQFDENAYYGIPSILETRGEISESVFPIKVPKKVFDLYLNYMDSKDLIAKNSARIIGMVREDGTRIPFDETELEYEDCDWVKIVIAELRVLELANDLILEKRNEYNVGWLDYIKSNSNIRINLSMASSGFIQIFPIVFFLFYQLANRDENPLITIIEQPELHLHPKAQIKLLETFLRAMEIYNYNYSENFLLVETHSEHILKKIQLEIAKNPQLNDLVSVYFLNEDKKNNRTTVEKIEIDENGFLKTPFPEGFFDEASELALALLEAQLKRKN